MTKDFEIPRKLDGDDVAFKNGFIDGGSPYASDMLAAIDAELSRLLARKFGFVAAAYVRNPAVDIHDEASSLGMPADHPAYPAVAAVFDVMRSESMHFGEVLNAGGYNRYLEWAGLPQVDFAPDEPEQIL